MDWTTDGGRRTVQRAAVVVVGLTLALGALGGYASAEDPPKGDENVPFGTGDSVFEGGREKDDQTQEFIQAKLENRIYRDKDGVPRIHDTPPPDLDRVLHDRGVASVMVPT